MTAELQFNTEGLETHNELRRLHNAPNMTINDLLMSDAQDWARHMAETMKLEHSKPDGKYGENIASSSKKLNGQEVTLMWYREIFDYNFNDEKQNLAKTGHFSQVVWKSSLEIGFGLEKSTNGMWYYCSRYLPPGNCVGKYLEHVNNYGKNWIDHPLIIKISQHRHPSLGSQKSEENSEMKLVGISKKTTIVNGIQTTELVETFVNEDGTKNIKKTIVEKV